MGNHWGGTFTFASPNQNAWGDVSLRPPIIAAPVLDIHRPNAWLTSDHSSWLDVN